MKNYEISDVLIKTSNLAEYIAAHTLISKISGKEVYKNFLNYSCGEYPYVGYYKSDDYIAACAYDCGRKVIPFSKLENLNLPDFIKFLEDLFKVPELYFHPNNEPMEDDLIVSIRTDQTNGQVIITDRFDDNVHIPFKTFDKMIEAYQEWKTSK